MPDFPAAPFYSADDITGRPGDAALSGIGADFDPANKNPLGALQQTFDRVDAENNQAIEAGKQRAFQAEQQRIQFQQQQQQAAEKRQNDILMKHMEYDHDDKINQNQQALKDRQTMFNMFNQSGGTAATLKDEQGNDAGIGFLPEDQQQLSTDSKDLQDWVYKDPTKNLYSSDFTAKNAELKQKRVNASMRSYYVKQAQQQLQNTFDPEERKRLTDYANQVQSEPITKMPAPYQQQPTVKPLIDVEKDYKDGKGLESFDDGSGVPNTRYVGLANTTDPQLINEGFKRYEFFQKTPQGQNADAYNNWKQSLDKLTTQRGLPAVDIPAVVTPDGKVVFDDSTYAKKQKIARSMLTATELMNNGYLRNADEDDALKVKKTKAEIDEINARTGKVKAETEKEAKGEPTKPLTVQEAADQHSSKVTVGRVKNIFDANKYRGFGTHVQRADGDKVVTNTVDGVNVAPILKDKGYDPADWGVFKPPTDDLKDLSGVQETKPDKDKIDKPTGETKTPDKVLALKNNKTGDVKLAYFAKGKGDKYSLLALVGPREAVGNAAKHKHQYKTENSQLSDEISRNEAEYDNGGNSPAAAAPGGKNTGNDETTIRARLVPITIKKKDGSLVKAMKDPITNKRYAL